MKGGMKGGKVYICPIMSFLFPHRYACLSRTPPSLPLLYFSYPTGKHRRRGGQHGRQQQQQWWTDPIRNG